MFYCLIHATIHHFLIYHTCVFLPKQMHKYFLTKIKYYNFVKGIIHLTCHETSRLKLTHQNTVFSYPLQARTAVTLIKSFQVVVLGLYKLLHKTNHTKLLQRGNRHTDQEEKSNELLPQMNLIYNFILVFNSIFIYLKITIKILILTLLNPFFFVSNPK